MEYKLTVTPLTAKQRENLVDDGMIIFVVPIDVNDLITWDIEYLNDHACEMSGAIGLSDIDYHVVGHKRDEIYLQIRGMIDMDEE